MAIGLTKQICLALFLSLIATSQALQCEHPRVRREWRSISEIEREEWIAAVKVGTEQRIYFVLADPVTVPQQGASQVDLETHPERVRDTDSPCQSRQFLFRWYL